MNRTHRLLTRESVGKTLSMAAQFLMSAESVRQLPPAHGSELAMVGRSNAGKSALINAWAKQKSLARVSQKPGKTEHLNLYRMEPELFLVDMPGYGYAHRGQEARKSWSPMIEEYLLKRENLKGVILVVDCARRWAAEEEDLLEWLTYQDRKTLLVINKIDRLNQKELAAVKKHFQSIPGVTDSLFISAQKGTGIEAFQRTVFEKLLRT